MKKNLLASALIKFSAGVVLLGLLLFLPAGTLAYPNGWLLMGLLFVPMFAAGLVMLKKSPALLERRLNAKEKEFEQKRVIALSALMFLAGFVLAGLDFRFQWIVLPRWISVLGAAVFLTAYALYAEVLRENEWLSRTIEVQEGQKVVDTGLYGVVRHPMYAVTLALFLSMPLVLGSLVSFACFLVYPFIIARRIRNEEAVLEKELDGYCEYKTRVRWKMIPFIW